MKYQNVFVKNTKKKIKKNGMKRQANAGWVMENWEGGGDYE